MSKNEISHFTKINYVQVDSAQRKNRQDMIYSVPHNLPSNPLYFTNGSTKIHVYLPNQPFHVGDIVVLNNITSKNVIMENILSVKKYSNYLRILQSSHGLSAYGRYDKNDPNDFVQIDYVDYLPRSYETESVIADSTTYYILKHQPILTVQLSGITGNSGEFIGDIPINYLNSIHKIYLIFTKNGESYIMDKNSYLIKLPQKSTTNYANKSNMVYIKYNNLYGISLSILNSMADNHYLSVTDISKNSFTVSIDYAAIVDPEVSFSDQSLNILYQMGIDVNLYKSGGGDRAIVRKVIDTLNFYPEPNNYHYPLDRIYQNVSEVKLIGSSFPNSQQIINKSNNKLYWRNWNSGSHIYSLTVPPGNYSPTDLADTISNIFSTIPKKINYHNVQSQYDKNGYYQYHLFDVKISDITDTVSFSSFDMYVQNGDILNPKILIPDTFIHLTIPSYFPEDKILLIYFTSNSHDQTDMPNLIHNYKQLYKYDSGKVNHNEAILITEQALLINFNKKNFTEINSINTNTKFDQFFYDIQTNKITKPGHNLNIGDLIVTDKLDSFGIWIYEITEIIDPNQIYIKKNKNYLLIYDGINLETGDELILTDIIIKPNHKNLMIINHPKHNLYKGAQIIIDGAKTTNSIPETAINATHQIWKILDDDWYAVKLDIDIPIYVDISDSPYQISIKYPSIFQMLFNYEDSLGTLLNFKNDVTPYSHTIVSNGKINMTGYDYFYLCCPQLNTINHTGCVSNVFAIIYWTQNPNHIIYNSFVPTIKYFNPHLGQLSELYFSMYHPNGQLVEFNGLNHSFVLEISENNKKF